MRADRHEARAAPLGVRPAALGRDAVTIVLEPVSCGTALHVEQANIPAPIPLEMCHLGWQESLEQLARLVEPEIRG